MNKKILGIGAAVILVGAYVYLGEIENKVEDAVRAKIAETPILVETVRYNALFDTLHLNNLVLKQGDQDLDVTLNVSTVAITGFNTDILDAEEELPLVFDDLAIKDLNVDLKASNNASAKFVIDSFNMDAYEHNIAKLLEEFKKNQFSEEYFEAFINHKHGGIEIKGSQFVFENGEAEVSTNASIERIKVKETGTSLLSSSVDYENIALINDLVDLRIALFGFEDAQLLGAKALSIMVPALLTMDIRVQEQGSQAYVDMINDLSGYLDYSSRSFSSTLSIKDAKLLLKDAYLVDIKNSEISVENIRVDLESGDKPSVAYIVENFVMSPEYISLAFPNGADAINALITENIVMSMKSKTALDSESKLLTFEGFASVTPLFESTSNGTARYNGEDFWNLFNVDSNDSLELVAYEKVENNYTDKGLIPLAVYLLAEKTGLPVESLLQLAKSQLIASPNMFKTGQENIDAALVDIAQALVAMFDKPGSVDFDVQFNTPYNIMDMFENPPTDFEMDIDVKQGDKTIMELIPASLLQ